ncbi:hypothetical protein QFC24_007091 [Naganishia onofrii]|uniref:Uncharacterized protein n=1 Tax=Naganishia onofrii TaxID=1851511 RepID=A0ACC2WTI8_9TREE|nr:hypothetical protein QFC24_007091 [Naganishia onofrii]
MTIGIAHLTDQIATVWQASNGLIESLEHANAALVEHKILQGTALEKLRQQMAANAKEWEGRARETEERYAACDMQLMARQKEVLSLKRKSVPIGQRAQVSRDGRRFDDRHQSQRQGERPSVKKDDLEVARLCKRLASYSLILPTVEGAVLGDLVDFMINVMTGSGRPADEACSEATCETLKRWRVWYNVTDSTIVFGNVAKDRRHPVVRQSTLSLIG